MLRKASVSAMLWVALVICGAESGAKEMLFRHEATQSSDLAVFPKWNEMLARYHTEQMNKETCVPEEGIPCQNQGWREYKKQWKALSAYHKLVKVQEYINRARYITDPVNWGVPDYWSTPAQFYVKEGDCEDYAISKFLLLRALGIPNQAMKVVVLNDENLKVLHAVLAVRIGKKEWILDNQTAAPVPAEGIYHYTPIYAVNETHWWHYL